MTKIILQARLHFCKLALNPLFIIKIEDGIATVVSGKVKNGFANDCQDIAKRNQLRSGLVYAINGSYGKPVLKASGEIKGDILQQLRNIWSFSS